MSSVIKYPGLINPYGITSNNNSLYTLLDSGNANVISLYNNYTAWDTSYSCLYDSNSNTGPIAIDTTNNYLYLISSYRYNTGGTSGNYIYTTDSSLIQFDINSSTSTFLNGNLLPMINNYILIYTNIVYDPCNNYLYIAANYTLNLEQDLNSSGVVPATNFYNTLLPSYSYIIKYNLNDNTYNTLNIGGLWYCTGLVFDPVNNYLYIGNNNTYTPTVINDVSFNNYVEPYIIFYNITLDSFSIVDVSGLGIVMGLTYDKYNNSLYIANNVYSHIQTVLSGPNNANIDISLNYGYLVKYNITKLKSTTIPINVTNTFYYDSSTNATNGVANITYYPNYFTGVTFNDYDKCVYIVNTPSNEIICYNTLGDGDNLYNFEISANFVSSTNICVNNNTSTPYTDNDFKPYNISIANNNLYVCGTEASTIYSIFEYPLNTNGYSLQTTNSISYYTNESINNVLISAIDMVVVDNELLVTNNNLTSGAGFDTPLISKVLLSEGAPYQIINYPDAPCITNSFITGDNSSNIFYYDTSYTIVKYNTVKNEVICTYDLSNSTYPPIYYPSCLCYSKEVLYVSYNSNIDYPFYYNNSIATITKLDNSSNYVINSNWGYNSINTYNNLFFYSNKICIYNDPYNRFVDYLIYINVYDTYTVNAFTIINGVLSGQTELYSGKDLYSLYVKDNYLYILDASFLDINGDYRGQPYLYYITLLQLKTNTNNLPTSTPIPTSPVQFSTLYNLCNTYSNNNLYNGLIAHNNFLYISNNNNNNSTDNSNNSIQLTPVYNKNNETTFFNYETWLIEPLIVNVNNYTNPNSLVFDACNNNLYIANGNSNNNSDYIVSVDINNLTSTPTYDYPNYGISVIGGTNYSSLTPYGLAMDYSNNYLYFSNTTESTSPPLNSYVYCLDITTYTIVNNSYLFDAASYSNVSSNNYTIPSLAYHLGYLYIALNSTNSSNNNNTYMIIKLNPTSLDTTYLLTDNLISSLTIYRENLYWASLNTNIINYIFLPYFDNSSSIINTINLTIDSSNISINGGITIYEDILYISNNQGSESFISFYPLPPFTPLPTPIPSPTYTPTPTPSPTPTLTPSPTPYPSVTYPATIPQDNPRGMNTNNGYLYVANYNGFNTNYIQQINLTNFSIDLEWFNPGITDLSFGPLDLTFDSSGNMYIANYNEGVVSKLIIENNSPSTYIPNWSNLSNYFTTTVTNCPWSICIDSNTNILYFTTNNINEVLYQDINSADSSNNTPSLFATMPNTGNLTNGITYYDSNLYVSCSPWDTESSDAVYQIPVDNSSNVQSFLSSSDVYNPSYLTAYNNNLYISDTSNILQVNINNTNNIVNLLEISGSFVPSGGLNVYNNVLYISSYNDDSGEGYIYLYPLPTFNVTVALDSSATLQSSFDACNNGLTYTLCNSLYYNPTYSGNIFNIVASINYRTSSGINGTYPSALYTCDTSNPNNYVYSWVSSTSNLSDLIQYYVYVPPPTPTPTLTPTPNPTGPTPTPTPTPKPTSVPTGPTPTAVNPFPCFKKDTKILTNAGYVPVQNLKEGDMVKTMRHGYKPIHTFVKKIIYHEASSEKIPDQLYRLSRKIYPDLIEDLIITGRHCILVDKITKIQEEEILNLNGQIFYTDNKVRLPACIDKRATVYERAQKYNIYHFSLEHDDDTKNYGIYANGLLVESCSIRICDIFSKL